MNGQRVLATAAVALLVAGCSAAGAGNGATATPNGSPASSATPVAPTPPPTPVPTATPVPTPAAFTLRILPAEEPVQARVAIPGEAVSFLVVVDSTGSKEPVAISATAKGAKITEIRPPQLVPGAVGEVWLVPDPTDVESTAQVSFTATRGAVTRADARSISIFPMKDERAKDAKPYFDRWLAWLVKEHPELGITAKTVWSPTFVSTFLVVSHYAYYSQDWELHVSWHNMIPPYDWTEIYLRHRGTETSPSLAFRIDSVKGKTAPHSVAPPEAVMR